MRKIISAVLLFSLMLMTVFSVAYSAGQTASVLDNSSLSLVIGGETPIWACLGMGLVLGVGIGTGNGLAVLGAGLFILTNCTGP